MLIGCRKRASLRACRVVRYERDSKRLLYDQGHFIKTWGGIRHHMNITRSQFFKCIGGAIAALGLAKMSPWLSLAPAFAQPLPGEKRGALKSPGWATGASNSNQSAAQSFYSTPGFPPIPHARRHTEILKISKKWISCFSPTATSTISWHPTPAP